MLTIKIIALNNFLRTSVCAKLPLFLIINDYRRNKVRMASFDVDKDPLSTKVNKYLVETLYHCIWLTLMATKSLN